MAQCTSLLLPGQAAGALVDRGCCGRLYCFVANSISVWRTLLARHIRAERSLIRGRPPFAERL